MELWVSSFETLTSKFSGTWGGVSDLHLSLILILGASREKLAMLWAHEAYAVLCDRLCVDGDRRLCESKLCEVAERHFDVGGKSWLPTALFRDAEKPLVFADLCNDNSLRAESLPVARYEAVFNGARLRDALQKHLAPDQPCDDDDDDDKSLEEELPKSSNNSHLLAGAGAARVARVYRSMRTCRCAVSRRVASDPSGVESGLQKLSRLSLLFKRERGVRDGSSVDSLCVCVPVRPPLLFLKVAR